MDLKYLSQIILDRAQAELAVQNRKTAQALEMAEVMCDIETVLRKAGFTPVYSLNRTYPAWMMQGGSDGMDEMLNPCLSAHGYTLFGAHCASGTCLRAHHENGILTFDIIFLNHTEE